MTLTEHKSLHVQNIIQRVTIQIVEVGGWMSHSLQRLSFVTISQEGKTFTYMIWLCIVMISNLFQALHQVTA